MTMTVTLCFERNKEKLSSNAISITFPIVPDQHLAHTEDPVLVAGARHPPDHHLVLAALQLAGQPHVRAGRHDVLHHAQHTPVSGQQRNCNKTQTLRRGVTIFCIFLCKSLHLAVREFFKRLSRLLQRNVGVLSQNRDLVTVRTGGRTYKVTSGGECLTSFI